MDAGDGMGSAIGGTANDRSAGGRLVATDGRTLPLKWVSIRADTRGGLARVVLEQRFVNAFAEALRITYLVPLPVDGALAGYAVRVGERRITGEVDRITEARERFETALLEGRSAGLVEQERPNLFTLELGNVPSGVDVVAELTIDQPLAWLDEGTWEWRFPTVVAPRFLGADGRLTDADRVTVDIADAPIAVDARVRLVVRDELPDGGAPASPSHAIAVTPGISGLEVSVADGAVELDRDVVIRWPAATRATGLALDVARPAAGHPHAVVAYGLLTMVPPSPEGRPNTTPRDLIMLFDTSGSMDGEPLKQAQAVACALVESLGADDQIELIAFSNRPKRWQRQAVRATEAARRDAVAWLTALKADGGTEMKDAVNAALRPLRSDAQRQTVLITDGLIGFENEIVETVLHQLPTGSRLHTVGVGPSVNRALTAAAARAGRGTEVVIGLGEGVGPHVTRLLARMRAPVMTEIKISGTAVLDHVPAAVPDVYAGAPLRVALALRPEGGHILVHGQTPAGAWDGELIVPGIAEGDGGQALFKLYGREAVEDLEVERSAGVANVDHDIERIGLEFQIATRMTSWVAVSEEPTVDPRQPLRRERMPHALPQGLSIEGLGLRRVSLASTRVARKGAMSADEFSVSFRERSAPYTSVADTLADTFALIEGLFGPDGRRRLTCRLVLRTARELTFEIPLDTALDWAPEDIEVAWLDGTVIRAEIVAERTTAAGPVPAGLVVRLGVRLLAEGSETVPDQVLVTSAGTPLVIAVVDA
jgi:Ca-activated chloride channel family protein